MQRASFPTLHDNIVGSTDNPNIAQTAGSVASQMTELLRRTLPGDGQLFTTTTPPLFHPTTTTFTHADMETLAMVTSNAVPELDQEMSNNLAIDAAYESDKETRQSRPRLCINGVEVNLITNDDPAIPDYTKILESYLNEIAIASTPTSMKAITMTIPTTPEAFAEAIFGPMPTIAPLFSKALPTPPPTPPSTPPRSSSNFNASVIPCKREGSPLEKGDGKAQAAV